MFDRIEDTRAEETKTGVGLAGKSRIPQNKAHRFNIASALETKMANTPSSLSDLLVPLEGQPKPQERSHKKS